MSTAIKKLLDAKDPEAVKLWADSLYLAVQGLLNAAEAPAEEAVSVQRGVITITGANLTATATVTAVDMDTAELRFLGQDDQTNPIRIVLTNATTITASRTAGGTGTREVSWELTG